MEYIGEHLLPGKIGNAFVLLSFVFSILATVSYYFASKNNDQQNSWKKIGRSAFHLHALSVLGIMGSLFYMLYNHLFEYHYVWQHSNSEMPMRYIFSCFWEGQEGSFLLWTCWHAILGNILIKTSKDWEAPVMTIFSSVQIFLCSMLLGIYVGDYHIGSNPFTLLREMPENIGLPWTKLTDYLQRIPIFKDGRGLNPLLQNYWMTIHPPVLFLGFASTLIPFCYAISALWKKRLTDWVAPVLPWAFFGVTVLGTGILMGGAWAYEALSFGGFWAWDPVENASLVPWLTFVGAAHTMMIYKHRGESVFSALFFTIITFLLILYSTFLTRSGILGETSVHAFTDLGMSGQLLVYLLFYLALSIVLIIINIKNFPKQEKEEPIWSREFWMFIGALILLIAAFQIIYTTSIPVLNKMFDLKMAPPSKPIEHYNSWQIPFAILVTLLIAVTQFFRYKNNNITDVLKKLALPFIISTPLTASIAFGLSLTNAFYILFLFSCIFAATANAHYWITILRGKVAKAGASLAHIGFGLLLLGALISTSKKEIISVNTSGSSVESLGKDFSNNTNILLSKGDTLKMGDYYVTYKGKRKEGVNIYFEIEYLNSKYEHQFTLNPLVQTNPRMGNVAEPDTKHFLHKDIYTHVTYADLETLEEKTDDNEFGEAKNNIIGVGDTLYSSNSMVILDSLVLKVDKNKMNIPDSSIAVGAQLRILDINQKTYHAMPVYVIKNQAVDPIEAVVEDLGLKFAFWKINPETNKIEISMSEKKSNRKDFIVMEAAVFPFINILWMGCIIMIIGTVIAIRERVRKL